MQGVEVCVGLSSPRLSSDRLHSAPPTLRLEVAASSTLTSAKNGLDIGVHLTVSSILMGLASFGIKNNS